MAIDIRVPELGESVTEAVIARWLKKSGDEVRADEPVLELETEKATMELVAPAAGRLEIAEAEGARVKVGTVVGRIAERAGGAPAPSAASSVPVAAEASPARPAEAPARQVPEGNGSEPPLSPAVRKLVAEHAVDPTAVAGTGKGGRLTKGDVLRHLEEHPAAATATPVPAASAGAAARPAATGGPDDVERVPMTPLRRRIAQRLVEAQRTAAILTTFNEVDLSELLALRKRYRERFRSAHGVDLGLMSLFGRACVLALRDVPVLNARIDGDAIAYHRRVHLGIAVSTSRGLVVPVVRNADGMTFAELERAIGELAALARDGKLVPDQLAGGTFTITNGGVFGSLLSTPILNPPQSGILGMHKIEDRPIARDGQVVIRPMMYVALSYDHRLVDGEGAVTFLVRVKERLEEPARMMLEI
jgi:2-oxoglutarate dehydrogenase E2 component (dihydrolipoamide succinyltransferase)